MSTRLRFTSGFRLAAGLLLVAGTVVAVCVDAGIARADTTAGGIVLTQDQLPDYQADEGDSITNTVGGSGDLASVLVSCAHGDPMLSHFAGGPDAAVGGAFGRGSYQGGFQNGVQSVAVVDSSASAAAQAFSTFSGSDFAGCVKQGSVGVFSSLAEVKSSTESAVTTPKLGDGTAAFDVVVQFSTSGLSGFDATTLTLIRSGNAIVLLVTFALGDTAAAAQFPDTDRLALAQLLVDRVAPALSSPAPPPGPALEKCVLSSTSVEISSSATAGLFELGADAGLTLTHSAGDAPYSVDADAGLEPALTAALGAEAGHQGIEADVSVGLKFSEGAGYEKLSAADANGLLAWLATDSGSNTAGARAKNPDSTTQAVGALTEGDLDAASASGKISAAVELGLKTDLHDGKETGEHVYLDITGSGSGELGALFGGMTVQSGAAADEEAILTLDAQPNGLAVGVSVHVTTDLLSAQQAKNAAALSDIHVDGTAQAQEGTETDIVVSSSASDDAQVTAALETIVEYILADSTGGPSQAAVSQAESVLAGVAQAVVLQSNLTKQGLDAEAKGGFSGLTVGAKAGTDALEKQLSYAAYSTPGSPSLVPWTACTPAASSLTGSSGPPPSGTVTQVVTFNPWVTSGSTGAARPAPNLNVIPASGTCDSGSPADPGRAAAYRCTPGAGSNLVLGPCFADTASGDAGAPLLCVADPTSQQAVLLSLGGTTLPAQATNTDDPGAAPWFLMLADGHSCRFAGVGTGTDVLTYDCGGGVGATQVDRSQPVWTVREGKFQADPTPSAARVAVTTAFR
ncbi:MAG TPA: hypothetical protein VFU65_06010 [Actinocrinis sp.]|nr:hypothetical protein [Actinocrinis sp.]